MVNPSPNRAQERFQIGISLIGEKRFDEAVEIFKALLSQGPRNTALLNILASLAYLTGNDAAAKGYLERVVHTLTIDLERAPAWSRPQLNLALANALLALGQDREAETKLENLSYQLNPFRSDHGEFREKRAVAQAKRMPGILLNSMPKSASESIWNRLADGLGMPQSHVSLGFFPSCALVGGRIQDLADGGFCAKEHIRATPYNLSLLKGRGIKKMVLHLRDPRQAALSWAHFLNEDILRRPMAAIWRQIVPPAAVIQGPFEGMTDWCVDKYLPLTLQFVEEWVSAAKDSVDWLEVKFTHFESFTSNPQAYFAELLDFYEIPQEAFVDLGGSGEQDAHFRSGQVEEWRSVFTAEQRQRAWAAIPKAIVERFGWTE